MNRNNPGSWDSNERGWPSGRGSGNNRGGGDTDRDYEPGGHQRSSSDPRREQRDPRNGESQYGQRRSEWDENPFGHQDVFDERERGGSEHHRGEGRWPGSSDYESGSYGAHSGYGSAGRGGAPRYEESGAYRNAWNDSPARNGGARSNLGARSGSTMPYGGQGYGSGGFGSSGGYGSSSYGSSSHSSAFGSPYDESRGAQGVSMRPGNQYSGRGPKGYSRSDERIREDVCERLTYDPEVDASDITVTVSNGEVTLEGEVENRHQKRRAEDVVERVNAVKDVHNQLKARRGLLASMVDEVTGRDQDQGNIGRGPKAGSH